MKKLTPVLILILIVGVVSVSGCISILDSDDNTTVTDNITADGIEVQDSDENLEASVVTHFNNSGNIIVSSEENSEKIRNTSSDIDESKKQEPKFSKEEIEEKVVKILELSDPYLNFTANATLYYQEDGTPFYLVDFYDDYGWYGFFEINALTGPIGNDEDGYSVDGGAVRGETGDEPRPINGIMPKLSQNDAREILEKELNSKYSIDNLVLPLVTGFIKDNNPYYNVSIESYDEDSVSTENLGYAIIDANSGEIISINLKEEAKTSENTDNSEKIYSVDEAGDYIDIVYKGKEVSVRENYPYYSPQNDKVYYSQEEEVEDLYNENIGD